MIHMIDMDEILQKFEVQRCKSSEARKKYGEDPATNSCFLVFVMREVFFIEAMALIKGEPFDEKEEVWKIVSEGKIPVMQ